MDLNVWVMAMSTRKTVASKSVVRKAAPRATHVKRRKPSARALVKDLSTLIADARTNAAREVNSMLVELYWRVGRQGSWWSIKNVRYDERERRRPKWDQPRPQVPSHDPARAADQKSFTRSGEEGLGAPIETIFRSLSNTR